MDFLKIPFAPEADVKFAVVDYRICTEAEASLRNYGIELIKTVKCPDLYEAVDGHPDMQLHHIGGNKIIMAPNIYDYLVHDFEKKGFAVTKGATWLVRNYPGNIAYNVLRMGDLAFHNTKYTDEVIAGELEKENVRLIHVNQGYTKCSTCILDSRTIITSDQKLAGIAEKFGVESLLIKPGGIELKSFAYGFIGGASGLLSKKRIAFTGSLESLEDNNRIIRFLTDRGFEIISLTKTKPIDYGSVIPLK